MKQITYIIISFIFWNTFLAMDNPGNTSLLKRLPGDMRRNIKKLVQEGQQKDKHLVVIPNLSTKSPEDYIKSTVWNRFGPVNWHYLWNKSTPGQISFYQVGPT